jgi:uncharacterized membrane protein YsdA (DUF1294 family)
MYDQLADVARALTAAMDARAWILALYALINLECFLLYGWDKRRAVKKKRRIAESTLIVNALCFGALGGMLGMYLFRHKTQKGKFVFALPVMFFVQFGLILYALLNAEVFAF